jgi:hypothetical protein
VKSLKIAIAIAGYPLVFFVGLLVGGAVGLYVLHGKQVSTYAEDPDFERVALDRALRSKDEQARGLALNEHLEFLNRGVEDLPTKDSSYTASDRALTLARLSALWKRLGDAPKSAEYLQAATSYCPKMKWNRCDASELLLNAARLDRGAFADESDKK